MLRFADHAHLGIRQAVDHGFAKAATAIPLVAAEFAMAGRDYPIVFSSDDTAMPLAVTGISANRNLFVADDGRWATGRYIPSYVRRYPFIGITVEEGGSVMLGIDAASSRITSNAEDDGAHLLFTQDAKATATAEAAMALCDAYAHEHARSEAFASALKAHNLLTARAVQLNYADARQARVEGFRIIDEQAYRALPSAVVVDFHAKGWLDLIVLHLASQANWQGLVEQSSAAA